MILMFQFPTSYKISRGRHSVSAEVYGEWNKPQNFKAPVSLLEKENKCQVHIAVNAV